MSGGYGQSVFLKRRYQPIPATVQLSAAERARSIRRMKWSLAGILACAGCMIIAVNSYSLPAPEKKQDDHSRADNSPHTRFDAPPSIAPDTGLEVEQISTGTSTIPTFPKTILLSSVALPEGSTNLSADEQEYQLVGLGIRTVSFLGIQVYVVGLYVAVPDIATLQQRLVRVIDPVASTLVPNEKDKLRDILLHPEQGEEVWNTVLQGGAIRTALRIVPTRNTDFMHLRDGWVRGITARTQSFAAKGEKAFSDESFGESLNAFKQIWGGGPRKNVPKGETLLLTRDGVGRMAAWYEDKTGVSLRIGGLDDERVSRLIWLGYLGGKTVSSEGARRSVIEGVMEFVGRPVGTVATQVV